MEEVHTGVEQSSFFVSGGLQETPASLPFDHTIGEDNIETCKKKTLYSRDTPRTAATAVHTSCQKMNTNLRSIDTVLVLPL